MTSAGAKGKPAPSRTPSAAGAKAAPSSSTPSVAPSAAPTPPPLPDLSTLLNLPLRLTVIATGTIPQRDIEGSLFTYDSSFVVLAQTSSISPSKRSYQLIKTSQIKAVVVVSTTPDPSLPSPSTPLSSGPAPSAAELAAKVDKVVAEDRKQRARVGQGVSSEAQALFDALGKTMPVRWHGTSIVVLDEVRLPFLSSSRDSSDPFCTPQVMIEEPYGGENVKGGKGAADRVERIKRVVRLLSPFLLLHSITN